MSYCPARFLVAVMLCLAAGARPAVVAAQSWVPPDSLSDGAVISILTVSPGPMGVSSAGHTALRIQDPAYAMDLVVNYATRPSQPVLYLTRLIFGVEPGYVSLSSLSDFLFLPSLQKRTVHEQLLGLTTTERYGFWQHARQDLLIDGQPFMYNLLDDNCTTRIRDHIGAIPDIDVPNVSGSKPPRATLAPYFEKRPVLNQMLLLVFGRRADAVTDEADANYMPLDFQVALREAKTSLGSPLVRLERQILEYPESQIATPLPVFRLSYILLALVLGGLSVRAWRRGRLAWSLLDRLVAGWLGLLGLVLGALWLLGSYSMYSENMNLLWALPTHGLALFWRRVTPRRLRYIRTAALIMAAGIGLQLIGLQPLDPGLTFLLAVISVRWTSISPQEESPALGQ